MTMSNRERVTQAFELLGTGLAPFVERQLRRAYGEDWMPEVVKGLGELARQGSLGDPFFQLKIITVLWKDVCDGVLESKERTLAFELKDARNSWAHADLREPVSTADAFRVLDSAQRLLFAVKAEEADDLEESRQDLLGMLSQEHRRRRGGHVEAPSVEKPPVLTRSGDRSGAALKDGAMTVRVFSEKLGPGQREEFTNWIETHINDGFYINRGSMKLHRADCPHLELYGPGSTVKSEKICSTSRTALESWAGKRTRRLESCNDCAPRA